MNKRLTSLLVLLAFSSSILFAQTNTEVLLHTGKTVFPENARTYSSEATIAENEIVAGNYYRLLQFYELPNQQIHDNLSNAGIELLEYIPKNTYLAAIPAAFDWSNVGDFNIRSIVELSADLKTADELKADVLPEWATQRKQVEIMLKYHKNLRQNDVLQYCLADRIKVVQYNQYNNFLRVSIPQNRIAEIANLPYVAFVELRPAPDQPDDTEGRTLHRANAIDTQFPMGRKYDGTGISVLTRDDGEVGPHIDFQGRLNQGEGFAGEGIQHADGVSGIFVGAGNLNPKNRGMAAGADLHTLPYDASFLDKTMDLFFEENVLVTNSSYSNGCNDGYTQSTETVDQQIWDNPTLLHVFSAGNSGTNNCDYGAGNGWGNITGGHKQGKNVIATANLSSAGILENSSSRGPAHDGRIKPDIAANGINQISTLPNNEYYSFGGTSAASPGIAGITAMLHNAYQTLNAGATASSALLKAILLNTANDLGNVGPDFKHGWGHVNAYRAALALENESYLSGTVSLGETNTHQIEIPANVAEARLMVYWADQAGTVMTTKALVNDLNMSVTGLDASVHFPWVLDPTPDPALLDLPATTGVDDLNNVEQVVLDNPEAGTYLVNVEGLELPFGDHTYFVTWEFRLHEITVIYPIGGERLVTGETERIHWDAVGEDDSFSLEYSTDNGATWQLANVINGAERMYNWEVPNAITGEAQFRVSRAGISDVSDANFSIAPMPTGAEITKICPTFLRLEWEIVPDAVSYDVYLLGEKYMEVVNTALFNLDDIEVGNSFEEHWVAVSANFANGAKSRRTNAISAIAPLSNCQQSDDLRADQILSPDPTTGITCESPFTGEVTLEFTNIGSQNMDEVTLNYQVNDQTVVSENLGQTIASGETLTYTFGQDLEVTEDGIANLLVWVSTPNEDSPFDDTLRLDIPIFVSGGAAYQDIVEDFEGSIFPKENWRIENPDDASTFYKSGVIGITGDETEALAMNFYSYQDDGQLDYFYIEPLDLSTATGGIFLHFDLAYAYYNNTYQDAMRIEVSTDCGQTFNDIIYDKAADELATIPPMLMFFTPSDASEWRTEEVDLSPYIGMDKLLIRFVTINGYGNALYLDNINLQSSSLAPPIAAFEVSPTELCVGDTITFTSTSTGEMASYIWNFGQGAVPPTATGVGPHTVTYPLQSGDKAVALTVSNPAGSDTFDTILSVNAIPEGAFSFDIGNDGEVSFLADIDNASSLVWDFGNGEGSDDIDPTILYETEGVYTVTLTLSNECGEKTITQTVEVLSVFTKEVFGNLQLNLAPNPNNGTFVLTIDRMNASNSLTFALTDLHGIVIQQEKLPTTTGQIQYRFEQPNLPSGVYFLKISDQEYSAVTKIIIDK